MVKYKLIKKYPGSPELGTIVEGKFLGHYHDVSKKSTSITSNFVENQSEYWQEVKESSLLEEKVIEKDYEILSYIDENTKTVCNIINGKFLQSEIIGPYFTIEDAEDEIDFNIYSVKRL